MAGLEGKTLFITGASRGIGLAIAKRAARDGANIAVVAKTQEPNPKLEGTVETAAAEIEAAGGRALALSCDIRFEEQVERAVNATVAAFGGIDICVNNASALTLGSIGETTMKRYDLVNGINARGTFLVTKTCLPHLRKAENPHVLVLSPPLDLRPQWFAGHVAYAIAKYGMSLAVLGLAEELKGDGIAVNALWPRTTIATAAIRNVLGGEAVRAHEPHARHRRRRGLPGVPEARARLHRALPHRRQLPLRGGRRARFCPLQRGAGGAAGARLLRAGRASAPARCRHREGIVFRPPREEIPGEVKHRQLRNPDGGTALALSAPCANMAARTRNGSVRMATLLLTHPAFIRHDTGLGHPERPDRMRAIDKVLGHDVFRDLVREEAPLREDVQEHIARVHAPGYFEKIRAAVEHVDHLKQLDGDTVVSPGSWEAALRAVGAGLNAVDAVMAGRAANAFCQVRPPGHHAESNSILGFCLFSNAAIAAHYARSKHGAERVAVVDFDVHHGNGTQEIFWSDPDLFYGSTHQMPLFPGTGALDERGVGNVWNAPMRAGDGGERFREAFESRILPALHNFGPDYC